jgi:hypothetical protein
MLRDLCVALHRAHPSKVEMRERLEIIARLVTNLLQKPDHRVA